jgi:hypothetical protein
MTWTIVAILIGIEILYCCSIWADRVAAVWGGLLLVVMTMAWQGPPAHPLDDPGVWYILELTVGIPWLVLRGIDLIFTGRVRLGRTGEALGRIFHQRRDIVVMPPPPAPRWGQRDSGSTFREL